MVSLQGAFELKTSTEAVMRKLTTVTAASASLFRLTCAGLAVGALMAQWSPSALADTLHVTDDA